MTDPAAAETATRRADYRLRVAASRRGLVDALRLRDRAGIEALWSRGRSVPGGRAPNRLIETPGERDVIRLRPVFHGGLLARCLGDRFLSPRRTEREFVDWTTLHDRGVPLPDPVFAVSRRDGPFWRSVIATVDRPEARDGAAWLAEQPSAEAIRAAAQSLARTLRRLHDAGATHGDLHLRNLLIEGTAASPRCLLIDLDRARLRDAVSPPQRLRDWMRLARSLEKLGRHDLLTPRLRATCLAAYCEGDRALRRAMTQGLPREQRRLARHRLGWRIQRLVLGSGLAAAILSGAGCDAGDERSRGNAVREAPARWSLLAVGDTGRSQARGRLFEGQLAVAEAMTQEAADRPVDGMVLLGDNFYWHGLDADHLVARVQENLVSPYCRFLDLTGPRSAEVADACPFGPEERVPVPIFAVLGNHDLETPESPTLQREGIPDFLPGWRMADGLAESLTVGPGISLILFESEVAIDDEPAIAAALGRAIDEAEGPWRILATHRPIATDDFAQPHHGGYPAYVRRAIAAAQKPVQLVLAAHHHNLQVFEIDSPPLLHIGVGSGSRAEPPIANDHPDARFGSIALGFARIDLLGSDARERLAVSIFQAPRWPWLSRFQPRRVVARFEVDLTGRVTEPGSE